jgi:type V secretory pathway adhesin AidA
MTLRKQTHHDANARLLQNLLKGTVDGRAHGLALVEVDGSKSALANALGSELEFLKKDKQVSTGVFFYQVVICS